MKNKKSKKPTIKYCDTFKYWYQNPYNWLAIIMIAPLAFYCLELRWELHLKYKYCRDNNLSHGLFFESPDGITSKANDTWYNKAHSEGEVPLWNPYIFSGMPWVVHLPDIGICVLVWMGICTSIPLRIFFELMSAVNIFTFILLYICWQEFVVPIKLED